MAAGRRCDDTDEPERPQDASVDHASVPSIRDGAHWKNEGRSLINAPYAVQRRSVTHRLGSGERRSLSPTGPATTPAPGLNSGAMREMGRESVRGTSARRERPTR